MSIPLSESIFSMSNPCQEIFIASDLSPYREIEWNRKCHICKLFYYNDELATIDVTLHEYTNGSQIVQALPICEQCLTKALNQIKKISKQKEEIIRELDLTQ